MSQGRVIDIIIIGGSYSLQYYSFWKGTQIIGIYTEFIRNLYGCFLGVARAQEIFEGNL